MLAGRVTEWGSKSGIRNYLDKKIKQIKEKTKSKHCVICFSSKTNFRKELNPNYKSSRKSLKPAVFEYVKQYLSQNYTALEREGLEADDLIGILATFHGKIKNIPEGEKVIWSMDKDFKTVPSVFFRENAKGKLKKFIVSVKGADYNWLLQTFAGDSTDGYNGCPNVGKTRAIKILGEVKDFDLKTAWEKVLHTFAEHGLNKNEAVLQARCARILRAEDYDFKTKEIKLWQKTIT